LTASFRLLAVEDGIAESGLDASLLVTHKTVVVEQWLPQDDRGRLFPIVEILTKVTRVDSRSPLFFENEPVIATLGNKPARPIAIAY
jgi:hypothetical protein